MTVSPGVEVQLAVGGALRLACGDRRAGGPTAPAEGLALVAVGYDLIVNDGTP